MYLKNKDLILAFSGQYDPAESDQGYWLFQLSSIHLYQRTQSLSYQRLK